MMRSFFLCLFLAVIISGCSTVKLKSGAEKIRFTNTLPKTCIFLGEVHGFQDGSTVAYARGNDIEIGAQNDIKNKAFDLGANTIQLLTTTHSTRSTFSLMGNAYRCPE